jgi:fumarate reductase subunit C
MSRQPYNREVPRVRWFLNHPRYLRYMARELTCLFIGAYTLVLIVGVARLSEGQSEYETFLSALQTPASVAFHVVALLFATYHSITWFNLTPKALPVQVGTRLLPGWAIAGAHYAIWAFLSAGVLLFAGALS